MRRSAVLALLPALASSGCIPVMLNRPSQIEYTENDVPPIERLGRWDGAAFLSVEAGSVEPTRVHVIVHGWAPGWHRDGHPPSEPAWAAEIDRRPFDPWMHELAAALRERDPHAAVLVYSWIDDAATSSSPLAQRRAYARTSEHGRRLAAGLEAALHPRFREVGGQIHLIGHSFGARVAATAAAELPAPPRHLTVLDAPDAGYVALFNTRAGLPALLRRLPLGTRPGETFVDNYISAVGTDYRFLEGLEGVVDVRTTPPLGAFELGRRHIYAAEFYARTAATGFGIGWSPLLRGTPPRGCFTQPYDELELVPLCG